MRPKYSTTSARYQYPMLKNKVKRTVLSIDKRIGLLGAAGAFGVLAATWVPCLFYDCE